MLTQSAFAAHIADTIREPLLVLDDGFRVLAANRAFFAVFRLRPDAVEGRSLFDVGDGEWDIPALRTLLQSILPDAKSFAEFEVDHVFPTSGRRVMWLNGREMVGLESPERAILLVIEDITDRRIAEERLAEQTIELQRSNRELEQFAAIASHDLQEPLRKIRTYADVLQQRHAAALDAPATDYLARIASAAGRMQTLIGDLLQLSRITAAPRPFVPVALDAVVRDVLVDMEVAMRESGGTVDVGPLPTVTADPVQMRQLFQNLLSNAIKFRRPEVAPRIVVRDATHHGMSGAPHVITVSDNGIGFDQQYATLIFEPFQRLHGRTEYGGTGIGLAITERIVRRHGGTIAARGASGAGATIIIELPSGAATRPVTTLAQPNP